MERDHLQPHLGDMLPPEGYHLRTRPTMHTQPAELFMLWFVYLCSSLTTCDTKLTDATNLEMS